MKNLQFALTVEPDNVRIAQKLSWAQKKREASLPTVPSTIEEELETNPFMRVDLPEVQVLFSLMTVTHPGVVKMKDYATWSLIRVFVSDTRHSDKGVGQV